MADLAAARAVLDGTVLVPTPDAPSQPGTVAVEARDVVTAALHEDDDGLAFAAFTSPDAVLRWRPEGAVCVERPARWAAELAAVDPAGRLAIDPGSADAVVLGPADLASLLLGGAEEDGGAGAGAPQVLVASPSVPLGPEVSAAVAVAVAAEPAATSARHVVVDQGDGTPGPCVAVAFDPDAAPEAVGAAMARIVAGVADRSADAAGLTFVVSEGPLRPSLDAAGTEVWAR